MSQSRNRCATLIEAYASLPIFVFDTLRMAVATAVVYYTLIGSTTNSPGVYAWLAIFIWLWFAITQALYLTIYAQFTSKVLLHTPKLPFPDVVKTVEFYFLALSGIRWRRGVTGLLESLTSFSIRTLLFAIFMGAGLCLAIENILYGHLGEVWFTTHFQYSNALSTPTCLINDIVDNFLQYFFIITNDQLVEEATLYLDGLLFNIFNIRARLRLFLIYAAPYIEQACHGSEVEVKLSSDNIALTLLVIACILSFQPFLFYFKDMRFALNNSTFWLLTAAVLAGIAGSLFILNDIVVTSTSFMLSFISPGVLTRSYTTIGINGFTCLLTMCVSALLLAIPTDRVTSKQSLKEAEVRSYTPSISNFIGHLLKTFRIHMKNFFRSFFRLVLSGAFIFSIGVLLYSIYVGQKGFPVNTAYFQAINGSVLPEWAQENTLERALFDISTYPQSCKDLNKDCLRDYLKSIVATETIAHEQYMDIIWSKYKPFLCAASITGCVITSVTSFEAISGLLVSLEGAVIDAVFVIIETQAKVIQVIVNDVLHVVNFIALEEVFVQVLQPLINAAFTIYDFLLVIDNLVEKIPVRALLPFIPGFLILICILGNILCLIWKSFGKLIHVSLALFMATSIMGVTFGLLIFIEQWQRLGYSTIILYDRDIALSDIMLVLLATSSCLMLGSLDLDYDEDTMQMQHLLDEFEADRPAARKSKLIEKLPLLSKKV